MNELEPAVVVTRELEPLIPNFLANRRRDLEALRAALAAADFPAVGEIGHRLKGVGASYGFDKISAIGRQIEIDARAQDHAAVASQVDAYAGHLARVRVAYG
ncbi:MAG: hypothetical protein A3I63_10010 [Betaproteobacteria bacterium RIFCSPLOWO2_02_FULL_66_14]|nr:MAG: hypothetical protein A3I63_10010 [Betaproteobacteria bacterium RIFCSPLOWO2_02_FULL_66_14]